ncbi:MAG TPA: NAD(P)-dependent oxidoreductase [Actinospica sp.]|nr:NAD(P)-dependent oxidoreductase [Actinospica sp.]
MATTRVGWVGTGRMGAAMIRRLARGGEGGGGGVELAVWNRTRAKAEALGVPVVERVGDLADRDVVFTTVSGSAELALVVTGPDGLLSGPDAAPGVIVDCSTVSAEVSAEVRAAAADRGTAFLAAPVSGNAKVVAAGRLGFAVSGPLDVLRRVEPLLRLIGESVTYVGEGEAARLVKICHNLLLGVVSQSLAEILVLAEKGGVSRAALLDFVNHSVLGSPFSRYKTPAFVQLDYTPTFTPVLLRKDFDLGLDSARELGVPLPVAALVQQLVQGTIGGGRGAADFAVLLEQQAAAAGLELKAEDVEIDDGLG